jgi:hypothetical protein
VRCCADHEQVLRSRFKNQKVFEKQMGHSELDHDFEVLKGNFIVTIEAAGEHQPGESSFDSLLFGQDDKFSGVTVLGDFHHGGKHGCRPSDQFCRYKRPPAKTFRMSRISPNRQISTAHAPTRS